MATNYILPSNKKAIAHFRALGINLSPSTLTKERGIYYGNPNDTYYDTWDILLVDVNISAKKFHDYLKTHGLLLSQTTQH